MPRLAWNPQPAYRDFFYTKRADIIKNRTVFLPGITNFVPYGGRGSAKTWTFADAVIVEGSLRPVRVLVTREIQKSIDESIKAELEAAIEKRGISHFYDIFETKIKGRNGTQFIFKGLRNNINSIKSIADVDIVLAEESEGISKNSWDKFLPSIRPRSGKAPIIIVIFNPDDELDDTYQRFIVNPEPGTVSKLINWRDNIHFPPHLERQRVHCLKTRPRKDYDNIWEGAPKGADDDVIIDREWVRAARFASNDPRFVHVRNGKKVCYDPAGQGRDFNAVVAADGNIVTHIDEWLKSKDLRVATHKAFDYVTDLDADEFAYDECGGYGDGISVFVDDYIDEIKKARGGNFEVDVKPFNAGHAVANPDEDIEGTAKTNGETYGNLKAQAHGITAQILYSTYRFIVLGHDVDPADMISIDIEDDEIFNKLVKELSCPLWVKSRVNNKKLVEDKKAMEERTEQPSPNIADAFHMLNAPYDEEYGVFDVFLNRKAS
jgi:phage terminase large subunit